MILGWDFDGRIRLAPQRDDCPPLGDFLRSLVEQRGDLEIRILVWSVAVLHAPGAPLPLLFGAPWQDHPRITLRLDRNHPIYAAHHQKIVCIDDALAFAGGIDLTVRRWDTCGHHAEDPHRTSPEGPAYSPVHDVQMAVTGDAARAVAQVARERWQAATGETLVPLPQPGDVWPDSVAPDFIDAPVGIARTAPQWGGSPKIREIAALTDDAIAAARHAIYIEAQYLASRRVRDRLADSLEAPHGPEIVVVVTSASHGMVERWIMGENRDRLIRVLRKADRHGRFRVFYPVVPTAAGDCDVLIHAKLMIVDDDLLRVGSANLNNRSVGVDTECDLAVEARDATARQTIRGLRDRLLAEHLGVAPEAVREAVEAEHSLIRGIESLNCNSRCLRPFPESRGPVRSVFGTGLLDPARPFEPMWFLRRPKVQQPRPKRVSRKRTRVRHGD
jgi:phosphatidylserine/phosphatidylglycerophosphate/cardiolipin synthase-like enzyme